jgi:hypothetical protein
MAVIAQRSFVTLQGRAAVAELQFVGQEATDDVRQGHM